MKSVYIGLTISAYKQLFRAKQRLAALFFVILMLFGALAPTASVLAATADATTPQDHSTSTTPSIGKINYNSPPVLPTVPSNNPVAADVTSSSSSGSGVINSLAGKVNEEPMYSPADAKKATFQHHELLDKRTATSTVFQNKDGSLTRTDYYAPHFYKDSSGNWQTIDTTLVPDDNAADSGSLFGQALGTVEAQLSSPNAYMTKATGNSWQARFTPSDFSGGMVRIREGNEQFGFAPVGAKAGVTPVITTDGSGRQTVHYYDLWPGVDVQYMVFSDEIKESIVLKDKSATSQVQFQLVGADLQTPSAGVTSGLTVHGVMNDQFSIVPPSVALNNFGPQADQLSGLTQTYSDGILTVGLNSNYLQSLPDKAFPAVIDPTVTNNSSFGTRGGGNYMSFETTGASCLADACGLGLEAGSLVDQNQVTQYWRGALFSPYDFLNSPGVTFTSATLNLQQYAGLGALAGTTASNTFQVGHAICLNGFNCADKVWDSASIGTSGSISVTDIYQALINNHDWNAWLMLMGEGGPNNTFKAFDPNNSYVTFTYSDSIPSPSFMTPFSGQVYSDPQASFALNTESNPNNGTPLQYEMQVTSGPNLNGSVYDSGTPVTSTLWTVPDGVLQDGVTYYVQARSYDPSLSIYSPWSSPVSFKIDSREGVDKTQTADTLGPVSVDLATGNLATSTASHSSKALAGSLGVQLDYNSPYRSRPGLVGSYWNLPNGGSGIPSTTPDLTRVDQNVNFDWASGSPSIPIHSTYFAAQWNGYFIAPSTGTYYFGGVHDDWLAISVNGTQVYNTSACTGAPCFGTGVSLTAGQVASFQASYNQYTGADYAHIYVKGAVTQQVIPQTWLQTGARPLQQNNGLLGKYYTYTDTGVPPTIPNDNTGLFASRTDAAVSFNWNSSSPVPNGPALDVMARWTGYVTVPVTGTYRFGALSDDGAKVTVNNTLVYSNWQDNQGGAEGYDPTGITLTAGTPVPITVDYYQHIARNQMYLKVYAPGATTPQVVPTSWLSTQTQVLPSGWKLGVGLTYEHLSIDQNSAILTDSSGDTHEYTWTGTGYNPPTNEYGRLERNNDGSFTLQDSDGTTYTFDNTGTLTSSTSALDDRNAAALKYTFSGGALQQITDGVTANRYMKLYYSGAAQCGTPPTGFGNTPTGMLCAAQTDDSRTTYFYYDTSGNLARVALPGNENTDYQYDTLGRLVSIRDSLANDAVAAGQRSADSTVLTQIAYDNAGRVSSVTEPQPNSTSTPAAIQHTFAYLYGTGNGQNGSTLGVTQEHITGASEPNGYSRQVGYDYKFRTIQDTDVMGNTTTTVWDPVKDLQQSTTDATGLRTTTIYDDDDRPISQYGPAPSSDFATFQLLDGQSMSEGQSLYSTDGRFQFAFQTDGNLVLYGPSGVMWQSGTGGHAATKLVMQTDGNLVMYNGGSPIWWTGSSGTSAYLVVQTDGNVVIYTPTAFIWQTNTAIGNPGTTNNYDKPLSAYTNAVPRTDTAYDAGMTGLSTAYFAVTDPTPNNASLVGSPLLHTTNIVSDGTITKDWGGISPIPNYSGNWGFSMTGTMRLPSSGNWSFNVSQDNGVRIWIDGQVLVDRWDDNPSFDKGQPVGEAATYNNTTANSLHRIQIDYYHLTAVSDANFSLSMTPPGGSSTTQVATYFAPDYSLPTSSTVYDANLGNTTSSTNYGTTPELGLAQSTSTDSTGLNLTSTASYETQGATGSFMRQTAKYLPGVSTSNTANATQYTYYAAGETRANPCVVNSPAVDQGGELKLKTDPSPDGGNTTGRTTETVYDDAGNIVATRVGSDPWTCITYDARGRIIEEDIPSLLGQPARTITDNYSVGGNPLVTSTTDSSGTITVTTDLLGRNVSYTDAKNNTTTSTYDSQGHLTARTSPIGTEGYTYDSYDRLTDVTLNSTNYAHVTYDSYGRISTVDYPGNVHLSTVSRDTLGRINGLSYKLANNSIISDSITRATTGDVLSGTEDGVSKSYTYDTAGRLTGATLGSNTYSYGYGTQSGTCAGSTNANSGKDSNRTSMTVNGTTTTYCYDYADRLVSSSDATITNPQYDAHGNTTSLGSTGNVTTFGYDSSDRNTSITQGSISTAYTRDVQGRIISRAYTNGSTNTNYYGFTAGGDTPDFMTDTSNNIVEKYLSLPGNVLITIRPQQSGGAAQVTSLPNIHGDIFATTDANGALTSTTLTGPFGEKISGQATPNNTASGSTFDWLGQNEKLTESAFTLLPTEMGARVYLPTLGRFLQVDPQEGGTPNNYVYPPDPVNDNDLTGDFGWKSFANLTSFASMIPGPVGMAAAAVSAAAYAKAGDRNDAVMMASAVMLAAVGAGIAAKGIQIAKDAYKARAAESAAKNLTEKMVYHEALTNGGRVKLTKLGDPRYQKLWQKREAVHSALDGTETTVHWLQQRFTGRITQVKIVHINLRRLRR